MKSETKGIFVKSPFTKEENKSWSVPQPASLSRNVSPPPSIRRKSSTQKPSTAAVEAGEDNVEDHLAFFSEKLLAAQRPIVVGQPRLSHHAWINLYTRNLNDKGHHFVIHQHDHPVAGIHYDLRLQCNATSSISFAIMYGLPGDPNSRRLNRNATETRVHNLWNHLIETASHQTGSMLLWDTGEYEVLPWRDLQSAGAVTDDDSTSDSETSDQHSDLRNGPVLSEPQKLHEAFQQRRLRLRLHGTRLPRGYTISLRLTSENYRDKQPQRPKRRRRKADPSMVDLRFKHRRTQYNTTDSESDQPPPLMRQSSSSTMTIKRSLSSLQRLESPPLSLDRSTTDSSREDTLSRIQSKSDSLLREDTEPSLASDDEGNNDNNEIIRQTNAYPGATNSINSIHQRKWFLSLDREASGFARSHTPSQSTSDSSNQPNSDNRPKIEGARRSIWIPLSSTDSNSRSKSNPASDTRQHTTKFRYSKSKPQGFKPFHVLGRDSERSIITGRLARDILRDEGVEGFVPRGGWRGVTD